MDDTADLAGVLDAYNAKRRGEHLARIRKHQVALSDLAETFLGSNVRLLRTAAVAISLALADAMQAELDERVESN